MARLSKSRNLSSHLNSLSDFQDDQYMRSSSEKLSGPEVLGDEVFVTKENFCDAHSAA